MIMDYKAIGIRPLRKRDIKKSEAYLNPVIISDKPKEFF